jgi:hypothetical protein
MLALEQKVTDLTSKFSLLHGNQTTATAKFGGTRFSSPQEVVPVIQAEISTSYFGCFVNAVILLSWILGNSGKDTLKNMGQMHKLQISSLAEVHMLKCLEAPLPRLLGDAIAFTGR